LDLDQIAQKYDKTKEEIERSVEAARRSLVPKTKRFTVVELGVQVKLAITREGVGPLNTIHGVFHHFRFHIDDKWDAYSVLVMAQLDAEFRPQFQNQYLRMRIDSGCETSQVFGDRTCECRQQLDLCLQKIAAIGEGMVVNIPQQDGRGFGLPFKLATLRVQADLGVDTIVASSLLDPDGSRDTRTYAGVIAILKFFDVPTSMPLYLISNNPKKMSLFAENGYTAELEPALVPPTELTRHHLLAKQTELGHVNLVHKTEDKIK
jgi:GTP cyclohydrolase II